MYVEVKMFAPVYAPPTGTVSRRNCREFVREAAFDMRSALRLCVLIACGGVCSAFIGAPVLPGGILQRSGVGGRCAAHALRRTVMRTADLSLFRYTRDRRRGGGKGVVSDRQSESPCSLYRWTCCAARPKRTCSCESRASARTASTNSPLSSR